ncbi:MAG: transposase, partial [Candidatus Methylomirabilales bacterium]
VTRLRTNARYRVLERRPVNPRTGVTSDQLIRLTGPRGKAYPHPLRRIGYRDPETGKHYVFLTTHLTLAAFTICAIYKERWQIELFFKWVKQRLKLKTFLGISPNAVLTQLWVALIVSLLLAYLKFKNWQLSRTAVGCP